MLLSTGASTLSTGLGNNRALTAALAANGGIDELSKDAPLNSAHLPDAIAVGTSAGLDAWLGAGTTA